MRKVDLNKLLVIGSSLDLQAETNSLAKILYGIIEKVTSLPSDGIVIYDEDTLDKLGINYLTEEKPLNHFDAGSKEH